jgi:glycine/D-amino acid oxidase-like deaminating enzyme
MSPAVRHPVQAAEAPDRGAAWTRRRLLRGAVAGLALPALLPGCVTSPATGRRLAPVRVAPERVIRQVAGLRPFRRRGFRVEAEMWDGKPVIHNYGHGGGGVSLSWGTGDQARTLALATGHRSAAVLGCGAVGLATARLLQDAGFAVTVYARELPPHTTSNVAGAQWAPVSVADEAARDPGFDARFVQASRYAHRYFQDLAGARYGVWWRDNYFLTDAPEIRLPWDWQLIGDLLPMTRLDPREHPFPQRHVRHFLTMHIEPATYLAQVLADFRLAGGLVVVRELADRAAVVALPEPLVVNCTGLGAGRLCNDPDVAPIRGQLLVLAPQPEVDYITVGPRGLYMMPRQDGIILGGTHEPDVWSLAPDPAAAQRLLAGHQAVFGQLRQ